MSRMPSHKDLMNPTLHALRDLGGSASIEELAEKVIENERYPASVTEVPHANGSQTEVEYRLAWARTYMKKAGLVDNSSRGVWALTKMGLQTDTVDPDEVARLVKVESTRATTSADAGPDDAEDWRGNLLEVLRGLRPDAFERLCQRLLRESGFIEVEVTGRSGDGGIDGHGILRLAGIISFTVLFQAKRYRDNIGASVVRDFRGAMVGRADKGVIITTAGFTRDARAEATRDGATPIDLITGDDLVEMLKRLGMGVEVRERIVEEITLDKGWFEAI